MKHVYEIQHQGMVWMNITKQEEKALRFAQKRFGFLSQDINEALPPYQRPKITQRPNYCFMVLHFPVFDRRTKRLGYTEIDFFLTPNSLVTAHDSRLVVLEKFFEECRKNEDIKKQFFNGTAAHILFELLSRLLDAVFPILLHVNEDINTVDKKMFTQTTDKEMAEEILRLKTNVVTFRRTMQGHRTVLERLITYSNREINISSFQNYINSLRDFANEIWHMLESQKESINTLHETNESLVNLHTNETMRILTTISVVTFPLTLLATLFSIQAKGTPLVNSSFGFYIIFGLIIFGAFIMVLLFKRKRWM